MKEANNLRLIKNGALCDRCDQGTANKAGIEMEMNCGIDTAIFKDEWRVVSPTCEIVVCEFPEKASIGQQELFSMEGAA